RKPPLLLINKVDNIKRELDASDFYQLGLPAVLTISAYHDRGVADALDWIVDHLPPASSEEDSQQSEEIRIAIVGRPNVGKSSLVNRLLKEERVIVSPTPGTTRDAIDTILEQGGRRFRLIDTAGIRRRGRIEAGAEQYSVFRALQALDRADIAILLLDATEGVADSDLHIASYVQQRTLGLITVMNKWDLIPRDAVAATDTLQHIRQRFDFAPYASVLLSSAATGFHVNHILEEAAHIWDQRQQRIPTAQLNAFVHDELQRHQFLRRGRLLKTLYATQVDINPPTFVFFLNDSSLIHFSYRRFIENELRRHFTFSATPLRLIFRGREDSSEAKSGPAGHGAASRH
ncbi:MAG: ribosome biogenesis GTPase Der, partial [Chloroflexi bacterium]|nr:ribosome biogenesis GTPase Der [Chloroflexota bacterium]